MSRVLKLGAMAFAAATALSGAAGLRARGAAHGHDELTRLEGVGPVDDVLPQGTVLARDAEELARLVAAPGGPRVIGLLPEAYRLDLEISRPLEIRGQRGSSLVGTGRGTVVDVKADDVTLKNLAIRGSGRRHTAEDAGVSASGQRIKLEHLDVEDCLFGISLRMCHDCLVDASRVVGRMDDPELRGDAIKLWESDRSIVRGSRVESARDIVVWYSRHVTLDGNVVTGSRYGSHFMYAHDSRVVNSRFVDDVVGVFVMYSTRVTVEDNVLAGASGPAGVGIGFKEADDVVLRRNAIVANTTGAYLDQSPRTPGKTLKLSGNLVALNRVGLRLHGAEKGATFEDNEFRENASMVLVDGTGDAPAVEFDGNYFSDYEGYDLDADGVGDVAYEERVLSADLMVTRPDLRLFDGSAAFGAVDAISRAVPMFGARRVLVDEHPRVAVSRGWSP